MTEASDVPFGLEVTKGVVAKFLLAAIGFVGTILFARILGPVAFGGFYLVWSVVQLAKLPIDGFAQASKKRFSETEANRSKIVGGTALVILAITVVTISIAVLGRRQIASYSNLENGYLLFIVLLVPIGWFTPFQGLVAATGRVSLTIWIDFLRSVLTTPLQLTFILLDYGAAGMAYGLSLATVATVPVTQYVLRTPPRLPDRATFRKLWSYARHSTVSAVLGRAYNRFDIVVLGILLTPAAAADYEVAMKLTLPAVLLSEVTSEGLMARVSNLHSKGENVAPDLTNTLAFSSILGLPIFFGSLVVGRPLVVTIYGPDYADAGTLLIGLALYRLLRTQTSPLTQVINGIDRPEVNVRISGVTLAFNVMLGVVLTLEFGSIGVVIATVAAESLRYAALAAAVNQRIPECEFIPFTLFEQMIAAAAMAVAIFGARRYVPIQSWVQLVALVSVGAFLYSVILLSISERLRYTVTAILRDAAVLEKDVE